MRAALSGKTDIFDLSQYITFSLGEENFAINIERMVEIIGVSTVTPVPKSKDFIQGVINLRGHITTIINIRERFSVKPEETSSKESKILIIDNGERGVGILVDRVGNIIRLKSGDVEALPVTVSVSMEKYLLGIGKYGGVLYSILDPDAIISQD